MTVDLEKGNSGKVVVIIVVLCTVLGFHVVKIMLVLKASHLSAMCNPERCGIHVVRTDVAIGDTKTTLYSRLEVGSLDPADDSFEGAVVLGSLLDEDVSSCVPFSRGNLAEAMV